MRNRVSIFTTVAAALVCAAFPGIAQGSCTTPCQSFQSGSGLSYPPNPSNNNVAWAQITVPNNAFAAGTTINHITVTLNSWTEASGGAGLGREFLLQAPSGQTFEFASEISSGNAFTVTWTFDDSAASNPPSGFGATLSTPATYKPDVVLPQGNTLNQVCENYASSPTFTPSSGVPGSYGTTVAGTHNQNCAQQSGASSLGAAFNGLSPSGTWTVWEFDAIADNSQGSVANVSISITPSVASGTTTAVSSSSPNAESFSGTSVTFTATVKSGQNNVSEGTVTFQDGNDTISGCGSIAVSGGTATCHYAPSGEGNHVITATFNGDANFATSSGTVTEFVDNQTTVSGSQFCNNGTVTLNEAGSGGTQPGSPYPQHVFVSGLNGSVTGVTLTLESVNAFLGPLRLLLVGPDGTSFVPLAGAGGLGSKFTGNLILSDSGGSLIPQSSNPSAATPYLPTDYVNSISFPSPAPTGTYKTPGTVGSDTFAATFASEPVNDPTNDKWSLYVAFNQGQGDTETTGGYCLTFTTSNLPATTTTVQANPQMQTTTGTSVTFTATVMSGNPAAPVTQGTVKFEENGTVLSGPTLLDNNGRATFTTSSLSEGIHNITAQYSGVAGSFNVSSGSVNEEIDTATTNPTTAQYCNPGGLIMGTVPSNAGETTTPYPSRINVTNLAGTVNSVSVELNGFTDDDPLFTLMMLEGPSGTNIVFWDDAGGGNPVTSPLNITFSDSATGQMADNSAPLSTSYQPTANNQNIAFAFPSTTIANQPPPNPSYAAAIGSQTLTKAFQNIDPNNYWSLFWIHRPSGQAATINNWCLNFTENPPALTANQTPATQDVTQGQSGSVVVAVQNGGPGSAGGSIPVVVTDTFPTGLTPTSGTGTGWSCDVSGQTITCTSTAFVASGSSFDALTINFSAGTSATVGTVSNTAGVSEGTLVSSVNSNPVSINIKAAPALSVAKTHSGTFTQGSTAEWDVAVSNTASGGTTQGTTTVVDTLPSGYTVSSFGSTSSSWTCLGATTGTATCTSTQAVAGGSAFPTIQIIVNVPSSSPTSVSNTAGAYGGGDPSHTSSATAATGSDSSVSVAQVPSTISVNGNATQSAAVSTAFGSLAVTVKDAAGVAIPNYPGVVFTATTATGGASGTFSNGTNTITIAAGSNGIADPGTFTANAKVGSYTVGVKAGATATASFNLTNTAGAAASIVVASGSGQTAQISQQFANPLLVTVTDSGGNPVSGATVTFTAGSVTGGASATLSTPLTTNGSGQTSVNATANTHVGGPYTVTASTSNGNGGTVTTTQGFSLTNTVGPAASIVVASGSGQTAQISQPFTNPLLVTVTDSGGNPVSGATVSFAAVAASNGASATLSNPAVTNSSGQTSVTATANNTAGGPYTVSASTSNGNGGTVTTTQGFSLTNTAGSAAHIAVASGSGQSTAILTAFSNPLVVTVTDSGQNPVSGVTVTFTAGAATGGASATLSSPLATNSSGQTSVTATANSHAGGPYTVTAAAGSITGASFSLTNTPGPAAHIVVASGSGQTALINQPFANPLVVTVTDSGQNLVSGATVTFTAGSTTGGASATLSAPAATNGSGQTSVTATANGILGGPYIVTASSGTATTAPGGFSLTNTTQYQLTTLVSPSGAGTVTPASGGNYAPGTVVSLKASPLPGYIFQNWTGTVANANSASTTVTMSANETVTANFTEGSTKLNTSLASTTGPLNARRWTFSIVNTGPGAANQAEISSLTLAQNSGTSCTPQITTGIPSSPVNMAPNSSISTTVTIDFSSCSPMAKFTVNGTLMANGKNLGTILLHNQKP